MNASRCLLLLLVLAVVPVLARADTEILTPDGVAASSEQTPFPASRLIDGSGIVGYNGQTSIELTSIHEGNIQQGWAASTNDLKPRLTYVWQAPQSICGLVLWQSVGSTGVKDFQLVALSADGSQLGSWAFTANEVTPVPGAAVDVQPQFFPIASDDQPLTGVQEMVLNVRSHYGGEYVSLFETHFAKPGQPREGEICVVDKRSRSRWSVPQDQKDESLWYLPSFDDGRWFPGGACLGYERDPLCTDLIVYLTMDNARVIQNTVLDTSNSPNVHNGTRVGTVPIAPGQVLEGLNFPGDQQNYVQIRHHAELNPDAGPYSVGLWVHPERENAPLGYIAQKYSQDTATGWLIATTTQNSFVSLALPTGESRTVAMPPLPTNQWSHIAFVINRDDLKFTGYLNGNPVDSVALDPRDTIANVQSVDLLNTLPFELKYRATLDDFAIWKRALSEEEMKFVYDSGAAGRSFKEVGSANGLYTGLIETNVEQPMYGNNASLWERIPFSLNSLSGIQGMRLKMHYDDGFVCYLNGTEIARRNAPSTAPPLPFNATSLGPRNDPEALTQEVIDVSSFTNLLVAGTNVLAIHGLNENRLADRFVIWPELCIDRIDCRGRNQGRDFWVTFPENFAGEPSNPKEISICVTGAAGTPGRVELPRLGVSIPFTLDASGRAKVFLNPNQAELSGSDVIEDKGVHIIASLPVNVVGLNHINYSTDGFLALPTKMLGTEHLVLGYPNVWPGVPAVNGTEFGLVATADGTKVQIIPSVETNGHPQGVPFYIDLDEGQTYQLINTEKGTGDLSGTVIRSTRPVAVFGGHRCANIRSGEFFCDHVVEHLPPVNHWRSRYFMGPLATRSGGDTVRVLAALDNTPVEFNGVLQTVLNRGQVYEALVTVPTEIRSGKNPVLVAQYSNSSDFDGVLNSDPFMALVPPPEAYTTAYRICSPPTGGFDRNFLNLTIANGTQGATTVDGVALPAIPGVIFSPIGATGAVHVIVPVSNTGPHDVFGPSPFGVIAYGFASYNFDSYGYSGGISFRDIPPTVTAPQETTLYTTNSSANSSVPVPNVASLSTAQDNCDPAPTLTLRQTPDITATLTPGTHLVTVYTTDSSGFTGTATALINVRPPWREFYFPNEFGNPATEATVWGWDADFDGDGWTTKQEWHFGSDPTDRKSVVVSGIVGENFDPDGLRLRYRRRYLDPSVTYTEEGSEDGFNWVSGPTVTRTISSEVLFPGGEYEEVVIEAIRTTQQPLPTRYFLRVRAEGCPPEG